MVQVGHGRLLLHRLLHQEADVVTQATTATAVELMCVGASFDLRQAPLNVLPGRTLISCGG